jgi:UDP-N-acetylmuramoylalanine--D-glutamate ligase
MRLKNKKVLVMGLGIHGGGEGAASYLVNKGARVTVTDLKTKAQLGPTLKKLSGLPIKYVLGQHRPNDFKKADLIIRNPDVPLNSPFLKIAHQHKIPILMEINLFWEECFRERIIGVTGTKGKTTTASLIKAALSSAGFKVVIGGNLGISLLEILPKIDKDTWVILELSSWQLEGLKSQRSSPHISVITNIFPDHLNRYSSMKDYAAAKKLIFAYQKRNDYLVLNQENSWTKQLQKEASGKVVLFSKKDVPESWQPEIKIPGDHNLANIAAALAVVKILKAKPRLIKEGVINFPGINHRLELVRTISGIKFYNDSAATNPTASQMAIRNFAQPLIWILGGADKNLDFTSLVKEAQRRINLKALIFLAGTATEKIKTKIKKYPLKAKIFGPFDKLLPAVYQARSIAKTGDIVLLSPGAASFGMFQNEFDRGDQFKKIVNDLAQQKPAL